MLAVIVPGAMAAPTVPVSPTVSTFTVANAQLVNEVCVALTSPLPEPLVVAIFYATPANPEGFTFLGALSNAMMSTIVKTGWEVVLPELKTNVALMKFEVLAAAEVTQLVRPPDVKIEYGKKVALNLYRYLESFNPSGDSTALQQALDRWLAKFESKSKVDPNFVFRTE